MMSEPLLEMKGISKSFGGNLVLSDVDFSLWPGEVHALVGENGAGKSTLMKILSGVLPRDAGSIRLEGREVSISSPHDARRAGISMIFQEHTLAPHLSVAENIFLGVEPAGHFGFLNNRTLARRAAAILERHGFPLDPTFRVSRLTRAEKQLVEIARALTTATRVIVMDEPTTMLSQRECDGLFRVVREMRNRGFALVYISHRMEELAQIADRITILRDGKRVFSGESASVDPSGIIRHMVGREIRELYPPRSESGGDTVLEVRRLGNGRQYRNISFELHKGEILGIAGLIGAGRTALARGIFGLDPPLEGSVLLRGKPVQLSASRAIAGGLAFLSEDRKVTCFPLLPLIHNITIAALHKLKFGPAINLAEELRQCRTLIHSLNIRAHSERELMYRLSGGNQQKAIIARWLFAGSSVLLLDEPTQGVDLGARVEIYRLAKEITRQGDAILWISSDLPELLAMSHRIAVMRRGSFVAVLPANRTSQEEIMRYAAFEEGAVSPANPGIASAEGSEASPS
jgi:ribose transport system ATP-binding protein